MPSIIGLKVKWKPSSWNVKGTLERLGLSCSVKKSPKPIQGSFNVKRTMALKFTLRDLPVVHRILFCDGHSIVTSIEQGCF
jgi:hypothetical protein